MKVKDMWVITEEEEKALLGCGVIDLPNILAD